MERLCIEHIGQTKYLFFTGKGGVGKTSLACAVAIALADSGERVLLLSTDPASNLQDVFGQSFGNHEMKIEGVDNLYAVNLDPEQAAAEYREQVVAPYRGVLPDSVITNMEEQLSGSCTVEIAAFNLFADFLTDKDKADSYDRIIFDTAPTGHTLRMLQLPSAWSNFISESTHGASCLGQLSGLEERKDTYKKAMTTLVDGDATLLVLVTRPDHSPIAEAARSSKELRRLGIANQMLVVNGVLSWQSDADGVMGNMYDLQQKALGQMPNELAQCRTYSVPLHSYNMSSVESVRHLLSVEENKNAPKTQKPSGASIDELVGDLFRSGKRVIFTMGKGGVGKTTVATAIAMKLKAMGAKVHLTTTDPANHIDYRLATEHGISVSRIDEKEALDKYKNEVRAKVANIMTAEDMEYVEEDLRSPCTQEIAVFRTFAEIVDKANDSIVIIDTAPTGHTLLLLDATESYHREVERTHGDIPAAVSKLLPRLRNDNETEVVIVTQPEATPVFEAERLQKELRRAGINNRWWVVNACLSLTDTSNPLLAARAAEEIKWIGRVEKLSDKHTALIAWKNDGQI